MASSLPLTDRPRGWRGGRLRGTDRDPVAQGEVGSSRRCRDHRRSTGGDDWRGLPARYRQSQSRLLAQAASERGTRRRADRRTSRGGRTASLSSGWRAPHFDPRGRELPRACDSRRQVAAGGARPPRRAPAASVAWTRSAPMPAALAAGGGLWPRRGGALPLRCACGLATGQPARGGANEPAARLRLARVRRFALARRLDRLEHW